MRNFSVGLGLVLLLLAFLSSCIKDELTPKKSVVFLIQADTTNTLVGLENIKINAIEKSGTGSYSAITDGNGMVKLQITLGLYSVNVSKSNSGFVINGNADNLLISASTDTVIIKSTIKPIGQGLIFKEIYYSGCTTLTGGSYFSDQYVEIYNNSGDTIFLDGVCFGFIDPLSHQVSVWSDPAQNPGLRIPVTQMTWIFPGSGRQTPLLPHTSVLIAQDAIDHKTDINGNPNSPVNLSNADYETYFDLSGKDLDNPAVPNLKYIFANTKTTFDWVIASTGQSLIMFRLPTGTDYQKFVQNQNNFSTKPGSSATTQFLMVDKRWVLDAVEIVKLEPDKQIKQLPVDLDAGKVWCNQLKAGKCIRRRVSELNNGVFTFADTNNSLVDFVGDQDPSPKVNVFIDFN